REVVVLVTSVIVQQGPAVRWVPNHEVCLANVCRGTVEAQNQMLSGRSDATLHDSATTRANGFRGEKHLRPEQLLVDNQVRLLRPDLCRTSSLLGLHQRIDRIKEHRNNDSYNAYPHCREPHRLPLRRLTSPCCALPAMRDS